MTPATPLPHRVRVAGSSSNLGPGFDCLGLALSLFVEARVVERRDEPGHAYGRREGAALEWSGGADDLFFRAVDAAAGRSALEPGWVFEIASDVPIARGLGSSGAAVAAGLLLGAALAGRAGGADLLALGLELEGHPDNVVASLTGGLTVGVPTPEATAPLARLSAPFHASLGVVVAWSADRMPTERARAVLPTRVDLADAVENARRLALLLSGLASGDVDLVAAGAEDRLHERYRLPLVPGGAATLAAMRAAGAPLATLSGSGSGLIAIAPIERLAAIRVAAQEALSRASSDVVARIVEVVRAAPEVETGY